MSGAPNNGFPPNALIIPSGFFFIHFQKLNVQETILLSGRKVCRTTFLTLHGIGKRRFDNLKEHFRVNALSPRIHGNKGRLPKRRCAFDTVTGVVTFINNFAQERAIALPGRIPGFKRTDIKVLPSSETKSSVFRLYQL